MKKHAHGNKKEALKEGKKKKSSKWDQSKIKGGNPTTNDCE